MSRGNLGEIMRQLLHDALADSRELVGEVVTDLRQENRLTDDEVLAQYEQVRGQPRALLEFAAQSVGAERAMDEALRYEKQMEELRRQRVGQLS